MRSIKNEPRQFAVRWKLAQFVRDNLDASVRDRYLSRETTLVPMPGHAPLKDKASHWPAREICEEFVQVGLGQLWLPVLERVRRVNKAAFSPRDERPTYETHLKSLRALAEIGVGSTITVVDDVITRGATLLAAVERLRHAYPGAQVQGFALVRTMSDVPLKEVTLPAEGTVRLQGTGTLRRP